MHSFQFLRSLKETGRSLSIEVDERLSKEKICSNRWLLLLFADEPFSKEWSISSCLAIVGIVFCSPSHPFDLDWATRTSLELQNSR